MYRSQSPSTLHRSPSHHPVTTSLTNLLLLMLSFPLLIYFPLHLLPYALFLILFWFLFLPLLPFFLLFAYLSLVLLISLIALFPPFIFPSFSLALLNLSFLLLSPILLSTFSFLFLIRPFFPAVVCILFLFTLCLLFYL